MADIDQDALETANKALVIIFIVLISIINLTLIFKISRKTGYKQCPKSMILIYLAFGDIVLATYSLVVEALMLFKTYLGATCGNQLLSDFYQKFFIHFLYSVGVFVLAAEMINRYRYTNPSVGYNSTVRAFFYSTAPWVLALAVVCPLVLLEVNWTFCIYSSSAERLNINFWVSVIAPACVAVIMSVIVAIVNLRPSSQSSVYGLDNVAYSSSSKHDILVNSQLSNSSGKQGNRLGGYETENRALMHNNHQVFYGTQPMQMTRNSEFPYETQPYPQQMQNSSQGYNGPQPYYQQPPPSYDHSQHIMNINSDDLSNPRKEKIVLVVVAILHLLLVLPNAIYYISPWSMDIGYWNTILVCGFYWLGNFRSIITPIIWIINLRN